MSRKRWVWIFTLLFSSCAWWPFGQTDTQAIVAGCGGGIVGAARGVAVNRDGRIVRWEQAAAQLPVKETMLHTDRKLARRLFDQLEAIGFTRIQLVEPSNVACHLSLRTASGSHAVVWPLGSERAPDSVRKLFAEIIHLDPATPRPRDGLEIIGRQPPPKPNLQVDPTAPRLSPRSPPLEIWRP